MEVTDTTNIFTGFDLFDLLNGTDLTTRNCSRSAELDLSTYSDQEWENCTAMTPFQRADNTGITKFFLCACYVIAAVAGILGNTLVIYVVLRYSKMQTTTNRYILNLALADELYLIGIPILVSTMFSSGWHFGYAMCKIYMTNTSISQFSSSFLLTIMSADRYIAVCHPISSQKFRTPAISKVVALTAWTASALMVIPIFKYSNIVMVDGSPNCNIVWPEPGFISGTTALTLYTFFMSFAVPLCMIATFYYLVVRKLKKVGLRNKSQEKKKSHRRVTKMVLTVITAYIICWSPYWTMQLALTFSDPRVEMPALTITLFLLSAFLSYVNSAVNPVLYAFLSDNFKKSFLKACTCTKRQDVNAMLNVENSIFTRRRSERQSRLRHFVSANTNTQKGETLEVSNVITLNTKCISTTGGTTPMIRSKEAHGNNNQLMISDL